MSYDYKDVIFSRGAKAIKVYCKTLVQQLEFTLEDPLCWTATDLPAMGEPPYRLNLGIRDRMSEYTANVPLGFTREEVLGYATDMTTVAVEQKIRREVEACRREAGGDR